MSNLCKVKAAFLAILISLSFSGLASADNSASAIVRAFNGLNGGKGFYFEPIHSVYHLLDTKDHTISGEIYALNWYEIDNQRMSEFPNVDAYRADSPFKTTGVQQVEKKGKFETVKYESLYYSTFCIAPTTDIMMHAFGVAKLSYVENTTEGGMMSITSEGRALTLGAATLYARFANGTLDNYHYDNGTPADIEARSQDAVALRDAIRYFMGVGTIDTLTNKFYLDLIVENSTLTDWMVTYDPGKYYKEIGDFSVFVMNVWQGPEPVQDLLYVAPSVSTPIVPEPATLLLWSIGAIGAAGVAYRKRRFAK